MVFILKYSIKSLKRVLRSRASLVILYESKFNKVNVRNFYKMFLVSFVVKIVAEFERSLSIRIRYD